MRKLTATALLAFLCLVSYAQNERTDICGTNRHMDVLIQPDPAIRERMDAIERFTQEKTRNESYQRTVNGVITIPVVVHVVYNSNKPQENISDAQIMSQIAVLNEDYRRLNADAAETLPQFQAVASDFELEFCLASFDPTGAPTTGIERRASTVATWGYGTNMKHYATGGLDAWPMDSYLNIWVCNIGGGIIGFATFPGGDPSNDGVVLLPNAFGSKDYDTNNDFYLASPYDLGRVTTHEVGHWLNLRHIWGDGPCSDDDFVEDTPRSDDSNYGCPFTHASCGTQDMIQNYMDYTDDVCSNIVTEGQKDRVRALFEPGGFRENMVNSQGCGQFTPECLAPTGIHAFASDNSALITFSGAAYGVSHDLEIAEAGYDFTLAQSFEDADPGVASGFEFTIEGLKTCTEYLVRVSSSCSEPGGYETAPVYSFTTTGPECEPPVCETPKNLYATDITFTRATLGWDAVDNAAEYRVQGRLAAGIGLFTVTRLVQTNSFRTNNLFPFLTYEFRAQTICDDLPASAYSDWFQFTLNPFATRYDGPANVESQLRVVDLFDTDHIISAYPNPGNGLFNLSYLGPDLRNVYVVVSDYTGKNLQEYGIDLLQNGTWQQDLSDLHTGLYLLTFRKEGVVLATEKVMVVK